MTRSLITLTSDFGVQTQGVGLMEGVARAIAPDAHVIHLMHGLPAFDITAAARTLETVQYLSVGAHVCVCDPGVGSARKAVALQVRRGDFLVGPDNGVLIPATRVLGGIVHAHEITNEKYMRHPVSPIFHGRDIFVPAAAHLVTGLAITVLGSAIRHDTLVSATYDEAILTSDGLSCRIIQINHFGSLHLNVTHALWDTLQLTEGSCVRLCSDNLPPIVLPFVKIFSDVPEKSPLILKDDYGRVEVAINLGSFADAYPFSVGDSILLRWENKDDN
jgi:S-adenosyl-L-methionine hydrolase (adenosine-forming)